MVIKNTKLIKQQQTTNKEDLKMTKMQVLNNQVKDIRFEFLMYQIKFMNKVIKIRTNPLTEREAARELVKIIDDILLLDNLSDNLQLIIKEMEVNGARDYIEHTIKEHIVDDYINEIIERTEVEEIIADEYIDAQTLLSKIEKEAARLVNFINK